MSPWSLSGRGVWLGVVMAGLGAMLPVAGAARDTAAEGWQALSRLKVEEAWQAFARDSAAASPAKAREAEFGVAVSLLAKQPVTAEQVEESRRRFAALADSGTDEVALGARYFLGRIAQHHQLQPDPAEAARQYRKLLAERETSLWAQTALSRLVLLELYPAGVETSPGERVAAAEKLLALAHLPAAQSELHLVLADAIFYYDLPPADALPHLLAAERLGRLDPPTRADVLVQIAEVSVIAGDHAQARRYYEKFLAEFPLDQRRFMVGKKLAGLAGGGMPPGVGR
jgi:tetratricopeptide (TPR) repeat protein